MKFKIGDRIRRINSEHGGMRVGDEDEIESFCCNEENAVLKNYKGNTGNYSHKISNLELIKEAVPQKSYSIF